MREIKFRAWNTKTNTWVEGLDLVIHTSGRLLQPGPNVMLMQYTGLKDRKGQEIYEGDIVKCYNGLRDMEVLREVQWESAHIQDDLSDTPLIVGGFIIDGLGGVEVIGNIHDDPELAPNDNGQFPLAVYPLYPIDDSAD
jgi:hypothetical protein